MSPLAGSPKFTSPLVIRVVSYVKRIPFRIISNILKIFYSQRFTFTKLYLFTAFSFHKKPVYLADFMRKIHVKLLLWCFVFVKDCPREYHENKMLERKDGLRYISLKELKERNFFNRLLE